LIERLETAHKDLAQLGVTIICGASDAMEALLLAGSAGCACTARPRAAAVKTF